MAVEPIRLPRLPQDVQFIDPKSGYPTNRGQRWWQRAMEQIEAGVNGVIEAQAAAEAAATAAENAQTAADNAQTAADIAAGAKLYASYCVRCHGGATVLPDLRRSAPAVLNGLDKILDGALAERGMPRFPEFNRAMVAQLRAYVLDERRKLAAEQK